MKPIIYFLALLLAGACTASPKQVKEKVTTLQWPPEHTLSTRELIDSVAVISLEVSDSALFGYPGAAAYTPTRIFVLGDESEASIKAFDPQGKYLNSIGRKGRGPGEFVNVFSFQALGDTLYIGDCMQRKLLLYHSDGRLLLEKQFPEEIKDILGGRDVLGITMLPLQQGYCVQPMRNMLDKDMEGNAREYLFTDRELRSVADPEMGEPGKPVWAQLNRKSRDTLTLLDNAGRVVKRFHVDFGTNRITQQVYEQLSVSELMKHKSFLTRALVCGNYVLLDLLDQGKRVRCALDWRTGQFYLNDPKADMREMLLNIYTVCQEEGSLMSLITLNSAAKVKGLPEETRTSLEENGGAVFVKYFIKNNSE